MNRRQLLASIVLSSTGLAGCYGVSQQLTTDDTDGSSRNSSSPPGESPTEPAQPSNSTDTPSDDTVDSDQSREKQQDQEQDRNQSQGTDQRQSESPPDGDPRSAVEIVSHESVFEEAADPQYGSDEFYLKLRFRNTSDHPLEYVRFDGYVFVEDGGEAVGHETLEYSTVKAGADIRDELPFFVDDPGQIEEYELSVSAAQWA